MSKGIIHTTAAPAPVGPYSQAVSVGPFLFCSGQISIIPETGEVFLGDIAKQTEIVMENVRAVLSAADRHFGDIVKTTIYLVDMADFQSVNEVYARYFEESPPARSCVAVKELPKGVRVEVEVTAYRS